MKRCLLILICLVVVGALTAGFWLDARAVVEEVAKGKLVGTEKCKVCHKSEKRGNQFAVWEKSAHANAYATLATDEAKAIATEKGLGDPQKEAECLICHSTQAFLGEVELDPKGKYVADEGVGCEACHGAGSEYKSNKVMKDVELAKAAGLLIPDQESCLNCHNEKSPTFKEFAYEERWAEIVHPKPAEE
jgi:hypothetical protein